VDFEPVAGGHDLLDDEPEDSLFDLESGVLEPIAQPIHHRPGPSDLMSGQVPAGGPGPELSLLLLHGGEPVLDGRLAGLEVLQLNGSVLVRIVWLPAVTSLNLPFYNRIQPQPDETRPGLVPY